MKPELMNLSNQARSSGRKPETFFVANGVVNIDRLVTNVVISTNNKIRDVFFQFVDVIVKIIHVLEFMVQSVDVGS